MIKPLSTAFKISCLQLKENWVSFLCCSFVLNRKNEVILNKVQRFIMKLYANLFLGSSEQKQHKIYSRLRKNITYRDSQQILKRWALPKSRRVFVEHEKSCHVARHTLNRFYGKVGSQHVSISTQLCAKYIKRNWFKTCLTSFACHG